MSSGLARPMQSEVTWAADQQRPLPLIPRPNTLNVFEELRGLGSKKIACMCSNSVELSCLDRCYATKNKVETR